MTGIDTDFISDLRRSVSSYYDYNFICEMSDLEQPMDIQKMSNNKIKKEFLYEDDNNSSIISSDDDHFHPLKEYNNKRYLKRERYDDDKDYIEKDFKLFKHNPIESPSPHSPPSSSTILFLPSGNKLLEISSMEYVNIILQITHTRCLTEIEIKEYKINLRKIKNREYAKESRQRKKETIEYLQKRVCLLEEEIIRLRSIIIDKK